MTAPQHDPSAVVSIRKTVSFSGHVQGVGFRYTTRAIAGDFRVTGYVQNLPDGRVELVAEGASQELDRFVTRIGEVMKRYIRETKSSDGPATGEFSRFGIAR